MATGRPHRGLAEWLRTPLLKQPFPRPWPSLCSGLEREASSQVVKNHRAERRTNEPALPSAGIPAHAHPLEGLMLKLKLRSFGPLMKN